MPRMQSILQQRAQRFRTKQAQQRKQMGPLAVSDDSPANYDEGLIVKPHMDYDRTTTDYKYTLQEAETNATTVETFSSSSEENTAYSDENESQLEGAEFLDIAYEAARQDRKSIRGHKYFDLVGESKSNYTENDRDDSESEQYVQPETIEFVDSEDGQVFNITQKHATAQQFGILQKVRSLDDSNTLATDGCSKTLNTNAETLREMPSMNEDDMAEMRMSNRIDNLNVNIGHNEYDDDEEEGFEAIEIDGPAAYEYDDYEQSEYHEHDDYEQDEYHEHDDYHDEEPAPNQHRPQVFDCDDGDMYYAQEGVSLVGNEEDGTVFSQLRSEHSGHSRNYQTHPSSMGVFEEEIQAGQWASVSNQVHYENEHHAHNNHQLEDPYLSDGNSSWEEGSFATGASRTLSRVDSAEDDYEEVETYQTFEGSYYSDEDSQEERDDQPMVRMLKKVRSNLEPERVGERSDEEREKDNHDKKKRSETRRRRRKKKNSHWIMDSVREIGTDVLDEAIEFVESKDKTETMINSFANLFSCGGNY